CPVGALTSKPYAFVARSWELAKTDSVDVLDAVGANIRIDARGPEVLRILPRTNDDVNEEWLGDKSRFAVDGLKRRRLDRPWVRRDGVLTPASWDEAFAAIAERLRGVAGERIGAISGDLCDAESLLALRDLMGALGSGNLDCRQRGERLESGRRDFHCFNTAIAGIDEADAIVLIGTDPRREAPVLNARIRKRWLAAGIPVFVVGPARDLTYPVTHLGEGPAALRALLAAPPEALRAAKNPMVVLGAAATARADGAAVLAAAWKLAADLGALRADWHGFNLLHHAAGLPLGLDLGFVPGAGGKDAAAMLAGGVDVLWLLGADEIDAARIPAGTFVIYQGHHGDRGAARADVILPGAAYTEKHGTYVNTEGRVQRGQPAIAPPGEAREDWTIPRALSAALGHALPYDDLDALRVRLEQVNPVFARTDYLPRFGCADPVGPSGDPAAMGDAPFAPAVTNYYQTDPISRASPTMAECTATHAAPVAQAAE
ncbi:MAG: molybdopterin-dependent oxidoreductase, partial [Rhodospirillales bacterium]|nr:molybdopterin-dependent oxidoreductase [Rhodospirillales bacterium]